MLARLACALLLVASLVTAALGQGVPISGLPAATTPLSGSEIVPLVQGGTTKQAPASAFSFPGGSNGQLQINNGSSGFSAYAGSNCGAGNFVSALSASGIVTCGAPSASPGGSNTDVQYNASGSFGGNSGFTYNGSTVGFPDSGTWGSGGINGTTIGATTPGAGTFNKLYANIGSITPTVSFPAANAFGVNESATGTCTSGANNCYFNFLNISSDNTVVGSASGPFVTGVGWYDLHQFGGSAMTGSRAAAVFSAKQTATTGNTGNATYAGIDAYASAAANDNGTGTAIGTSNGQIEGANIIAGLGAAATDFRAVQGIEVDTNLASGSSTYEKVGVQITQLSTDAVAGSTYDGALAFTNQSGAVGWTTGIQFGGNQGVWPLASTGTAIACVNSCGTLGTVLDFSGATVSNYFLRGPGFTVTGTGAEGINVGTLASAAQALSVTATQPASPSATQNALLFEITSAGSASQTNHGLRLDYLNGYTGSSVTRGGYFNNSAAGTASTMVPASGTSQSSGNAGAGGESNASTAGLNVGLVGGADNGTTSVGVIGLAQTAKNSGTNIGVVGSAVNTGSSPVEVGGFFSLNQTSVPAVSAALIADNASQSQPIALFRAAGVTKVSVDSTGNLIIGGGSATAGLATVSSGGVISSEASATVAQGGTGLASLTAHDLIVGNGTSAVTLLAPSSTSGIPLISQGASSNPAYGTAVVAGGGTGQTSLTANAFLTGNGTSGINQVAITGLVLGQGASAPTAYGGASCSGTNFITALSAAGAPTCGPTPTRAGDIYYYNGTNWVTLPGNNSGTLFLQETSLGVPSWQSVSGSGTVTSVATGTCLTGGTITTSGTINATCVPLPQGRLTLVSGTPILNANETAKATIYYDCLNGGNGVPYYNGTIDSIDNVAACEVSLTMVAGASTTTGDNTTTGGINNNAVFDVWWVHGGTNRICIANGAASSHSGGGWASDTGGSNTARGSGYSALDTTTRPYITNKNAITHCWNGSTDYGSVSANQGTYLGTVYTTAAGQTGMAFTASASGGGANVLGLFNAYNRVPVFAQSNDTVASFARSTAAGTWEVFDAAGTGSGLNNRLSWVDGLQQSSVIAIMTAGLSQNAGSTSTEAGIGINFDSTSATPSITQSYFQQASLVGSFVSPASVEANSLPLLGLHYAQMMSANLQATNGNWYCVRSTNDNACSITIRLAM